MKDVVILYHSDCPDGFGGAWAAWKKFGDEAEYIAVNHDTPPPHGLEGKEIYMIDFAYPVEIMKDILSRNKRTTAIDHHITREESVKLTQDYSYAIDYSGSVLAWQYFHPDKPVPKMLEYIEDRDLWLYKLKDTDQICAYLDSFDFNFNSWDKLISETENDSKRAEFIKYGEAMLNHEKRLMGRIIEDCSRLVNFEGQEVYCANAPHFFASHIGAILYKKKPPFAIIWYEGKDIIHVSLRSDNNFDVSKLAEKYGGGGHKASAGFSLPSITSFPWTPLEKSRP